MASEKSRLGLSEMQKREFQGNAKLAKTLLEPLINYENFFQCRKSCLGFSPKKRGQPTVNNVLFDQSCLLEMP